jgi:tetratricopeptide (TPR) repeat protein
MTHVDSDDLLRYRVEPSLLEDPAAVAGHLRTCETCSRELAAIDAEERALRDETTWAIVAATHAPPSARLQEALALRKRMDQENALARRLLEKLLRPSFRLIEMRIETRPAFLHAGTVRVLCETARQFHEQRPATALDIATVAYDVAKRLPEESSTDRRLCIAFAQRERANALRYLGRVRDALEALDEAEALLTHPVADVFDRAIVDLIRATVLVDGDRFEDAAPIAARAYDTFRVFQDTSRELAAVGVLAWCLMELGEARRAAELYELTTRTARAQGDFAMLARGLMNAGVAYRHVGEFCKAEELYFEAIPIFEELGLSSEIARCHLQVATVTAARGELHSAVELLSASRHELTAEGLTNDAAVATLRWAEVCLALEMPRGVVDALRQTIVAFKSEGMERRARIAVAYLSEAVEQGSATPALAKEVRKYIQRLPRHPELRFVSSAQLPS